MLHLTMIARVSDGLPLTASLQDGVIIFYIIHDLNINYYFL